MLKGPLAWRLPFATCEYTGSSGQRGKNGDFISIPLRNKNLFGVLPNGLGQHQLEAVLFAAESGTPSCLLRLAVPSDLLIKIS